MVCYAPLTAHRKGKGLTMDLNIGAKSLLLISRIMDNSSPTAYIIPPVPQKIAFTAKDYPSPLERSAPEKQGLDSDYISEYISAIRDDPTIHPQSMLIIKNGVVISETAFFPYRTDVWHISYSLCKSITGLAVGLLVDDGKLTLDTKLSDIFDKLPKLSSPRVKALTLRELLTMSTGIGFNEAGTVTEKDWFKSYFESAVYFEPGSKFSYNSMNSFMLSAIVTKLAGMSTSEFLDKRLFKAMGIVNYYWEKCPTGIEKGGMGLYLLPEDMAKLGLLYLQKGRWNGEQLISENWISEATKAQIEVPASVGTYNYGYQVWVKKERDYFSFNGMFGQNMLAFPQRDLLVAIYAGDNESFQTGEFFTITERYFGKEARLPGAKPDPLPLLRLRELEKSCAVTQKFRHSRWYKSFTRQDSKNAVAEIAGKSFDMDAGEGAAVGLLPLIAQALGNNYTRGIKRVAFDAPKGRLCLTLEENDESHSFPVGLGKAEYTTLTIHDEPYLVGVSGLFTVNEDDVLVLKVDVAFIETPNIRTIKFYFDPDGSIETKWSENPNQLYLLNGIKAVVDAAPDIGALSSFSNHLAKTYPARVIEKAFVHYVSGLPSPQPTETESAPAEG